MLVTLGLTRTTVAAGIQSPEMEPVICIAISILLLSSACQDTFSKEMEVESTNFSCSHPEFCSEAATCCQIGMDGYGWIAAAVGWSLWFLTLIIFCIDKMTKLRPDEFKH
ncbi:transmembrane protein 213 [Vipera latastei]